MDWFQITVLAIVQGVAEFLPISSSGHLVILNALLAQTGLGVQTDVTDVNIILHAGTLGSILIFYFRRVLRLLGEDRRVVGLLAVGTVPAVIVGLTIKIFFEHVIELPIVAGCMLPVTGLMLLWVAGKDDGKIDYARLTYKGALVIGCFQAFAILPGISRSGATIVGGLLLGMKRQEAATFSFLLAIPAILGATTLEMRELLSAHTVTTPISLLFAGALLSCLVGLLALWWLIRLVDRGRLYWFAWWCIPLGIVVIAWQTILWFNGG